MVEQVLRAQFGRKVANLQDLLDQTDYEGRGERFVISETIKLDASEWNKLANDFFDDYDWMEGKGGIVKESCIPARHCLLVYTDDCRHALLIDPQGYSYARYTAVIAKAVILAEGA